jgi:sulfur carrier protein
MIITLNGAKCEIRDETTLEHLLTTMGHNDRGVAASVDGEVVPRLEWQLIVLREGQAVEVLTAVQGG